MRQPRLSCIPKVATLLQARRRDRELRGTAPVARIGSRVARQATGTLKEVRGTRSSMAAFAPLRVEMAVMVAVAVLAVACGREAGSGKAVPRAPADLLLRGGAVYTMNAPRSWATAIGVREGRIVYVGSDSVPGGLVGPRERRWSTSGGRWCSRDFRTGTSTSSPPE